MLQPIFWGNTINVAAIIIKFTIDKTYLSLFLCWSSLENRYRYIVTYVVKELTIVYVLKDETPLQPLESLIHTYQ